MDTPISDFIKKYAESDAVRLHMPGHKGVGSAESHDITEIEGADVLYHANGIIKKSEENAAMLFGAGRTLYSAEGSSLSIRAALYLAMMYAKEIGRRPVVFAGRNAHKAFLTGVALLDLEVKWLCKDSDLGIAACNLNAKDIETSFCEGELPAALYLTSPDYLGNVSDIGAISAVCKRYGVLLIVDNAHGAYLNFLGESCHPMVLGADICCDSAHKTLPVLTGGGYLHISADAPLVVRDMAERAMSLFASTSPSYLILESLDRANAYLAGDFRGELSVLCGRIDRLKMTLRECGFTLIGDEPTKLTVAPKSYGYTGEELSAELMKSGIVCEFADKDFCVMMFTPQTPPEDIDKFSRILAALPKKTAITEVPPRSHLPKAAMTPREAIFSPSEEFPVEKAVGRIFGEIAVTCPPAIPIVVCGEVIDAEAIAMLRYYGVDKVRVIK